MEKRKLLIADSSEEFCIAITEKLHKEFTIKITNEGNEALTLLESFQPDVLVLDVILRGMDGLRFLETAASRDMLPKTMVITSVCSDFILGRLAQMEVSYVICKPCNLSIAAERIREISAFYTAAVQPNRNLPAAISEILSELGFQTKHDGYHYLCDAVARYMANPRQTLTKELYDSVAKAYTVGVSQVERGIRFAIESAWKCGDEQVWHHWLRVNTRKRPTNGAVIACLAEHLRVKKSVG